jgi:hypothetical protein
MDEKRNFLGHPSAQADAAQYCSRFAASSSNDRTEQDADGEMTGDHQTPQI